MDDSENTNVSEVLAVRFNHDKNVYTVSTSQGSSVNEMAFAVMVVIKTLMRDGYIKDSKEFIDLINKYLGDPQYEEVKNDDEYLPQ